MWLDKKVSRKDAKQRKNRRREEFNLLRLLFFLCFAPLRETATAPIPDAKPPFASGIYSVS